MTSDASGAVAQLAAAIDAVLALELDGLGDSEVLELMRSVEAQLRRGATVDHRLVGEVGRRGLAYAHGCASTAVLISQLLRVSASEARARVRAAADLAPRQALSGEVLEPLHPQVAAAQAAGELAPRHAALITATIDKIPAALDVGDTVAQVEGFLVEQARQFAPDQLGKIARHLLDVLDPDGTLRDSDYRDRHRTVDLVQRADGTVSGRFEGTAEFGELLLSALDVLAAPTPAQDGVRDDRTVGQRQHDGLVAAFRLMLRAGELPTANGVVATVLLTMTADQWAAACRGEDAGLARTGHGASVGVAEAKAMARGEARLFPVVLDNTDTGTDTDADTEADAGMLTGEPPALPAFRPPGEPHPLASIFQTARPIVAYGTSHRLFVEGQRLAMNARDRGCTFPGCTVPALWCEADHISDWTLSGRTSVDDGHLACPFHHREKDRNGWTVVMTDGLPAWIPPAWLDPTGMPRRNHAHDPVVVG